MKLLFTGLLGALSLAAAADSSNSPYGVCAHICKGDQWKLAEPKFQVMKPAGIRWVRNGFTWAQAEPEEGRWDYSKLDLVAETAARHEIDVLPILAYDVPWARPAHKHLDRWREYVRRTVSRYSGQFRHWEVWNEANISETSGVNTRLTPAEYVEVLKAAHEEIRKIDPGIRVLFTGTSGVPIPYIEECLKLGAADWFDIMNIHPYASNTYPENTAKQLDPLFELFRRYNLSKPIWVTEFSWPTHSVKSFMSPDVLRAALGKLDLDPQEITLAIIRNPDLEAVKIKIFDYTQDVFPNRREITYDDLKGLDVKAYPVLVPTLTQAFPRKYFKDLVDYVARGGTLLHSNGFPFYCDAVQDESGRWQQVPAPREDMMKELHIQWLAGWRDKVPHSGKLKAAPGLEKLSLPAGSRGGERYLSGANLKEGDELIPIFVQENGTFSAPVVGLYRFNSELKGAILADVTFSDSDGVSQEMQGKFLPRAYLYFLSAGIDKVFWYKFRAEETTPHGIGGHFGIVHRDYSPRDAFTAYRFLIRMLPEGSSRPVMERNGNLFQASWKRPDGTPVHAYWTMHGQETVTIPFAVREAYDHLGRGVEGVKAGDAVTVDDGILYLLEESPGNKQGGR